MKLAAVELPDDHPAVGVKLLQLSGVFAGSLVPDAVARRHLGRQPAGFASIFHVCKNIVRVNRFGHPVFDHQYGETGLDLQHGLGAQAM